MRTIVRIFLISFLVFAALPNSDAQTTGKKKYVKPETTAPKPDEPAAADSKKGPIKVVEKTSKVGYGINLGNLYFTNFSFSIGLDPNIAYKLDEALAVGFMLKMNYYYEKIRQYDLKFTAFDFGPTVFTRWKPLLKANNATPFMQGIFVQAEYERAFINRPTDEFGNIIVEGDKVVPFKTQENYLYIGAGMASGYPFSSFISFHYNIIDDVQLSRLPFTYRIGFTWNY